MGGWPCHSLLSLNAKIHSPFCTLRKQTLRKQTQTLRKQILVFFAFVYSKKTPNLPYIITYRTTLKLEATNEQKRTIANK